MQVKSIAGCSKRSILQYFRPALSNHLSLRFLFCRFLSGSFTQVLLYSASIMMYPSLGITVFHDTASLVIPHGDPQDGFFYSTFILMMDSYCFGIMKKNAKIVLALKVNYY